MKMNVIATI